MRDDTPPTIPIFASEDARQRLVNKFHKETAANLVTLRQNFDLLAAADTEPALRAIFLAAHTIKGNVGMLELLDVELPGLGEPAQELESLIYDLQDGTVSLSAEMTRQIENYIGELEKRHSMLHGTTEKL
jgi:chemotaxis protein histidine kinase CheA